MNNNRGDTMFNQIDKTEYVNIKICVNCDEWNELSVRECSACHQRMGLRMSMDDYRELVKERKKNKKKKKSS